VNAPPSWRIRAACAEDAPDWLALRAALWPDEDADSMQADIPNMLTQPGRCAGFLAVDATRRPIGFAEATLRHDYVNGTETSPVGFFEGWYVVPEHRGRGIGRALLDAAEAWARSHGCTEFASDALLDNRDSQRAHLTCGFAETERVVYFRKPV